MELSSGSSRKLAVRNKAPNPIQITAEQLLREAVERQADEVGPPKHRIIGPDELQDHRVRKRKDFEDGVRRNRHNIGLWMRYAEWEAVQGEFRRARSVFERALHVEFQNTGIWLKYIEMEITNKFINSARNLFDRVTGLLPRIDMFWLRYTHMEETLGNYAGCRALFERWMSWEPADKAWLSYVGFEERCREVDLARSVLERWVSTKPSQYSFLKMAEFEEKHKNILRARAAYEKGIEVLLEEENALNEDFFLAFAEFETRQKEFDRAQAIYQQALMHLPVNASLKLSRKHLAFQKQRGDLSMIQSAVLDKRRLHYEELLKEQPYNYDTWFDLLRLEEAAMGTPTTAVDPSAIQRTREVYERAIAQVPNKNSLRPLWKRYTYLWLNYALFEEIWAKATDRARVVYTKALELLGELRFAKLWIAAAEFEIRQGSLTGARNTFSRGSKVCPKAKLFKAWAYMELRIGDVNKSREVHLLYIKALPTDPASWIACADLEVALEEQDRARALLEKAVQLPAIRDPHLLWKRYLEMEQEWGEVEKVRALYERLLDKSSHFKVFKAYSEFEFSETKDVERGRKIIERSITLFKEQQMPYDRKFMVDHWIAMENLYGSKDKAADIVKTLKPKAVVVRRKAVDSQGDSVELGKPITTYVFPDDEIMQSKEEHVAFASKAKEMLKRMKSRKAPI